MLFNSLQYALFLPIVFTLYWLCPQRHRWIVLLAASYYFYMSWNVRYAALILLTTAVSYAAARLIEDSDDRRYKKTVLACALAVCLGVLFIFKYLGFFFESVNSVISVLGIRIIPSTLKLMLPVGISFYTFQTISYLIDVYKGQKAERHFGIYALFVSFFPQLVAGPIERSSALLPQIKAYHSFDYGKAVRGMKLIVVGLAKKMVIADNFAMYIDPVFENVKAHSGFTFVVVSAMFAVQIYCDFSGYSDIARGTAWLLGIELMENFRSPYFSTSFREFWSRWHISLSTWFRDYVYIPLGGSRVPRWRNYFNLMVTFLVSGLWHGANWTFVIWGAVHGVAQIAEKLLGIKSSRKPYSLKWFARVCVMFALSSLAWVFFRAQDLSDAVYILSNMTSGISSPVSYFVNGMHGAEIDRVVLTRLFVYLLPLIVYDLASVRIDPLEWVSRRNAVVRYIIYFSAILYIMLLHAVSKVEFVYFQF